jgi:hypothetical protein
VLGGALWRLVEEYRARQLATPAPPSTSVAGADVMSLPPKTK